jgi:hypothetical protein
MKKILIIALIVTIGFIVFTNSKKDSSSTTIYSTNLETKYISVADEIWPPKKIMAEGIFSCDESGSEIMAEGQTIFKEIDGSKYCITTISEGAAGSIYTTYTYKMGDSNITSETTFTLRFVQCVNYDDPQKTECELERSTFNVDTLGVAILNI